jgi:hypothetical protein
MKIYLAILVVSLILRQSHVVQYQTLKFWLYRWSQMLGPDLLYRWLGPGARCQSSPSVGQDTMVYPISSPIFPWSFWGWSPDQGPKNRLMGRDWGVLRGDVMTMWPIGKRKRMVLDGCSFQKNCCKLQENLQETFFCWIRSMAFHGIEHGPSWCFSEPSARLIYAKNIYI